jgi:hypothetical protein
VKTINFSLYIVMYNLIIGVLVMIASEKLGVYAGVLAGSRRAAAGRLVRIGALTFGACVATISGAIYLCSYVLKIS